jgi:predicted MFS family arabinose efflux permease
MLLIVLASGTVAFAAARHALIPLSLGFLALGAGLALPYATGPRLALSALAPADAGLGSGIINAGTFLGAAIGVAGGGVAFAFGGFSAVMALIALVGLAGTWLCRFISPPGAPVVRAARSHGRG